MFDIGMTELLIIGIVALIVVGPKDLPGMFRTLGRFMGKARAMARDFQRAMEQAADESGVKDMAKDFRDAASTRDFGGDEMKSFARNPDAWARNAARKSILSPEEEAEAAGEEAQTAAGKEPRGPATQALTKARSEAAEKRRAELAARRAAGAGSEAPAPDDTADAPAPTDRGDGGSADKS